MRKIPSGRVYTEAELTENHGFTEEELKEKLKSWKWRIQNLYYITDKDGKKVKFKMNMAQQLFFIGMHYRNIILKARQLGFTTFKMIFMLDQALFRDNTKCAVIAHSKDDASRLFREKIKFAYDNLPPSIKAMMPAKSDRAGEMVFANGSSITVGTSFRGGTLRYLHISEFGKICAKYPEKAKEIVTGAFEAVGKNCVITIESTAEGASGYFYKYSTEAEQSQLLQKRLTNLDWKFFFYPWFDDPKYRIDESSDLPQDLIDYIKDIEESSGKEAAEKERERILTPEPLPQRLVEYFFELEELLGVDLDEEQKNWYRVKEKTLGADMKREYPSTPKEAFEQIIEGAYYSKQIKDIYLEKRICSVPAETGSAVHTIWDLGYNDTNAIWFVQRVGREWRIVNYYENNGESLVFYINKVRELAAKYNYTLGLNIGPHDLNVHEYSTGVKRIDTAAKLGFKFLEAPKLPVIDGIEAVRNLLPNCYFDLVKTEVGFKHLSSYRKQWNDKLGLWRDKPLHDEASNGSDSFRYLAVSTKFIDEYAYSNIGAFNNEYDNYSDESMEGWV